MYQHVRCMLYVGPWRAEIDRAAAQRGDHSEGAGASMVDRGGEQQPQCCTRSSGEPVPVKPHPINYRDLYECSRRVFQLSPPLHSHPSAMGLFGVGRPTACPSPCTNQTEAINGFNTVFNDQKIYILIGKWRDVILLVLQLDKWRIRNLSVLPLPSSRPRHTRCICHSVWTLHCQLR